MVTPASNPVSRFLRRLSAAQLAANLSDAQLLERFASRRDEAAFAALVQRHGPLVLAACCRVLTDRHAAEDVCQAAFVVLARKAESIRRPAALGPWLYGVAVRIALKARARAARRLGCERRAAVAEAIEQGDDLVWRELRPVLDEAIAGLPEKHRLPFVLHHLQELTVAEVARRLGCPHGTVAARLARAKVQLRARLARRGLALSAGALAAALAQGTAVAAVPAPLAAGTVEAAMFAAGKAAGALAATASVLAKGGLHAMSVSKVKVALVVLVTVSAFGAGVGVSRVGTPGQQRAAGLAGTPTVEGVSEGAQPLGHAQAACARHHAGGLFSLRGFACRDIAPQADGGGDFLFLNSLEYQVPIKANDQLYLVPFLDSGTVERNISSHDYRVSAGVGLRITVPMLGPVPVNLDFGFPQRKGRDEQRQLFSFWLGHFS